jgi:hypothetical protein
MKEKQYQPSHNNERSPAPGMASVNTHNPGEEPEVLHEETETGHRINSGEQEREARDNSEER